VEIEFPIGHFEGNSLVHVAMRRNDVLYKYRTPQGRHNWAYWREALPEVLHFISVGFHQGIY